MNEKAQGALEYLIIVAAVLAIAAVVVTVLSGAFSGGQQSAAISDMKADASDCSQILTAEGYTPGTVEAANSTLCADTCTGSHWQSPDGNTDGTHIATLTSAGESTLNQTLTNPTPKDACLAGQPEWIRQK